MDVTSTGLRAAYPDTRVRLRATSLHAPLIERTLELPFDIYAGMPTCAGPCCGPCLQHTEPLNPSSGLLCAMGLWGVGPGAKVSGLKVMGELRQAPDATGRWMHQHRWAAAALSADAGRGPSHPGP